MGYRAPSAEQVYRHLFNLDRHAGVLTDGFCWSILFVNDNSEWSREFLRQYGTELCFRTADRARFVFFSHLSEETTQAILERSIHAEGPSSGQGRFLTRLLARVGRTDRQRYDFESPPWDELRPEALHPLRTAEEVVSQISVEAEMKSAIPGSQEALLFAQRLGIARFVPCFVVFTEVGASTVNLLPVAGMTTTEAFTHVRAWIDSFYEANREVLAYWKRVEDDIAAFCSERETSLSAMEGWLRSRRRRLDSLRKVAATLLAIDRAPLDETASVLQQLTDDSAVSWQERSELDGLVRRLKEFDARSQRRAAIEALAARVAEARSPEALRGELSDLRNNSLGVDRSKVTMWLAQLDLPTPPASPAQELVKWWRSDFSRPLSRNRHDHYRKAFSGYSERLHGDGAKGRVANLKRAEFAACYEAAMAASFLCPPNEAADAVLAGLASHLHVGATDSGWGVATASYRAHLCVRFSDMQEHAPSWLRSAAETMGLLVGDCIPTVGASGETLPSSFDQRPRLKEALNVAEAAQRDASNNAVQKRDQALAVVRDNILAELAAARKGLEAREGDIAAIREAASVALGSIRSGLSMVTIADALESAEAPFPGEAPGTHEASRLLTLLDRYDVEAAKVSFPFLRDDKLLRVGTPTSAIEAVGLETVAQERAGSARLLSDRVKEADRSSRASAARWPSVRAEMGELTPVGWLAELVRASLGEPRAQGVAQELGEDDLVSALRQLGVVPVLDRLSVDELVRLETDSRVTESWRPEPTAVTKEDLYDAIMANAGMSLAHDPRGFGFPRPISGKVRRELVDKVKRGQFDIFLAHNSVDRQAVLRLGSNLRARGISPWIDIEQVPPGRWFQDILQSVARSVRSVGVVIGLSGLGRWQALELRVFISRCVEDRIPVIPVLLPGVHGIPSDLIFLRELNAVAFEDSIDDDAPLARLVWGITEQRPV